MSLDCPCLELRDGSEKRDGERGMKARPGNRQRDREITGRWRRAKQRNGPNAARRERVEKHGRGGTGVLVAVCGLAAQEVPIGAALAILVGICQ